MPLVTSYQIVDAGCVRAFQVLVVVGILRNLKLKRGINDLRMVLYELKELLPKASADFEFRAREDFPVFRENGFGDVQPGGSGHRKHEHGALESVRFQSRRDEDICVDDEPERDHWRTDHRCTKSTTLRLLRAGGLAGGFDDPINLARAESVRALALRLVSDHPEHFWLGGGKSHIVTDAQQHRLRRAAFFDNKRPAFVCHSAQQLAEIGAGVQGGNHDTVMLDSSKHW